MSSEHVVAAGNPQLLEAKRLHQPQRVRKLDVGARTTRQPDKESRRLHDQRRYLDVVTPEYGPGHLVGFAHRSDRQRDHAGQPVSGR